jgi:hypothetical protein
VLLVCCADVGIQHNRMVARLNRILIVVSSLL